MTAQLPPAFSAWRAESISVTAHKCEHAEVLPADLALQSLHLQMLLSVSWFPVGMTTSQCLAFVNVIDVSRVGLANVQE